MTADEITDEDIKRLADLAYPGFLRELERRKILKWIEVDGKMIRNPEWKPIK